MKSIVLGALVAVIAMSSGSYANSAPFTDGANTIALWHCDSIDLSWGYGRVLDDDSAHPDRNIDWELKPWDVSQIATIEPSMPGFGNALRFNGTNQLARPDLAGNYGMNAGNFKVDLYLKLDGAKQNDGTRYDIFEQEGRMNFRVYDTVSSDGTPVWDFMWNTWGHKPSGQAAVTSIYGALNTDIAGWHHLTVSFVDGLQSIFIDDTLVNSKTASYTAVDAPSTEYGRIFFGGNRSENVYNLNGVLDEVMISSPVPEPATMLLLSLGGILLRKKLS